MGVLWYGWLGVFRREYFGLAGWEYLGGLLRYGWLGVFKREYFGMAGWEYLRRTVSVWLVGSI